MKTQIASILQLSIALFALCPFARAATILSYDFTGNPGTSSTVASSVSLGLTASDITFGPGVTPLATVNTMTATGFSTASTLTIANNDYWEFTITPTAGYEFTVDTITFAFLRASNGPKSVTIRTSLDAYASDASTPYTNLASSASLSFSLGVILDQDAPVTFRVYGYQAGSTGSSGALRGTQLFEVFGSVTAVPEPSSYAVGMGVVALSMCVLSRRKRVCRLN